MIKVRRHGQVSSSGRTDDDCRQQTLGLHSGGTCYEYKPAYRQPNPSVWCSAVCSGECQDSSESRRSNHRSSSNVSIPDSRSGGLVQIRTAPRFFTDFPSPSTELLESYLQKDDSIFFHVLLSLLATIIVTPKRKNVIKLIQYKVGKFNELWDNGFFANNSDRLRSTKRKHFRFVFKRSPIQISGRTPAILLRVIPLSLLIFDTDSFVT